MQASLVVVPATGAVLGAIGGFVSNAVLRRFEGKREQRALIFNEYIPKCHAAIGRYVSNVNRGGSLAWMAIEEVADELLEVYRATVVASRSDAVRGSALAQAARDLTIARRRYDSGDTPRRVREGGWAKLAWDTISRAEEALIEYETWLHVRLLGRGRRPRSEYRSIEIDRDRTGEDSARFACPEVLSGEYLSALLDRDVCSWAVLEDHPLYRTILVVWLASTAGDVLLRLYETENSWLHPLDISEESGFPGLWRVSAAIQHTVGVPSGRRVANSVLVIGDQELPPLVLAELTRAARPVDQT